MQLKNRQLAALRLKRSLERSFKLHEPTLGWQQTNLPSERIERMQRGYERLWQERQIHLAQRGPQPDLDPKDLRLTMRMALLEQQIARERVMGRYHNGLTSAELREIAMLRGRPLLARPLLAQE